jgi:hypothetical protein
MDSQVREAPQSSAPSGEVLGEWLVRLDVVARQNRFYPPDHPAIAPAMDALLGAGEAVGRRSVVLEISPQGFVPPSGDLGVAKARSRRLADQLFQIGMVAMVVRLPMSPEDLSVLAQLLAGLSDRPSEDDRQAALETAESIDGIDLVPLDASSFVFSDDLRTSLSSRSDAVWRQMVAQMTGGIVGGDDDDDTSSPSELADMVESAGDPFGFLETLVDHLTDVLGEAERRGAYLDGLALLTSAEEMIRAIRPENQKLAARLVIQAAEGGVGLRGHLPEALPIEVFLDGVEAMLDAGIEVPSNVAALLDSVARGVSSSSWRHDTSGEGFQDIQARAMDLGIRIHEAAPRVGPDGLHVPWRESPSIQDFLSSMVPQADLAWSLSEEALRRHSEDMLRTVYILWPSGFTSVTVGTRLVERYFDHLQLGEFFEASDLVQDLLQSDDSELLGTVSGGSGVDAILDAVSLWGKEHWRDVDQIVTLLGVRMVPALLERLQDEEALSRRKRLMEMILAIGKPAASAITDVLGDSRWFVVRNAILLLRRLNHTGAVDAVADHVRHRDHRVVAEVVRTLAAFGDGRWLQGYTALVRGDDAARREAVVIARRLRSPQIGALLAGRIAEMKAGDLRDPENLELIEVAGFQGGPEVAVELHRLAGLNQWMVPFRLTDAWSAVARSAARMPNGGGLEVLRRVAGLKDPAADVARRALAREEGGDRGR